MKIVISSLNRCSPFANHGWWESIMNDHTIRRHLAAAEAAAEAANSFTVLPTS